MKQHYINLPGKHDRDGLVEIKTWNELLKGISLIQIYNPTAQILSK